MTAPVSKQGADLDPSIRRFIEITGVDHARHAAGRTLSNPEARQVAELVRERWRAGGPQMHRTEDVDAPSPHGPVRVRLHDPLPGKAKPALVYVHGGGWTFFSLDTHDRIMREYAARAGVVVIGVDYDLSPEAKFPKALEQCVAVVRWAAAGVAGPAVDPSRVAIGGDSAGANLSLAASLVLRDTGEPDLIKGLLLNYGAFQPEIAAAYHARFGGDGYMLTSEEMVTFWDNYLASDADRTNPLAAPGLADLTGLPPAFLTIPECDVLTGQSRDMADRLAAAGVEVTAEIYQGASHSFLEAVSASDVADRALQDGSNWLKTTLN